MCRMQDGCSAAGGQYKMLPAIACVHAAQQGMMLGAACRSVVDYTTLDQCGLLHYRMWWQQLAK